MTDDELKQGTGQEQQDGREHLTVSRDEMEALQAEVAELRQQTAEVEAAKEAKRHGWRRFAVVALIVVGCLVAVVANCCRCVMSGRQKLMQVLCQTFCQRPSIFVKVNGLWPPSLRILKIVALRSLDQSTAR